MFILSDKIAGRRHWPYMSACYPLQICG